MHYIWDSFWDFQNDAWWLAAHEINRDSGYAGKIQATVSWFQKLTACWNYTELLSYDFQVADMYSSV